MSLAGVGAEEGDLDARADAVRGGMQHVGADLVRESSVRYRGAHGLAEEPFLVQPSAFALVGRAFGRGGDTETSAW